MIGRAPPRPKSRAAVRFAQPEPQAQPAQSAGAHVASAAQPGGLSASQQAQNLRFAAYVKGTGDRDEPTMMQHAPATAYPVDSFPVHPGYDGATGALVFADGTVLVHVRPDADEGECFPVMPATPMMMRMAQDRVDIASETPLREGAMRGTYDMCDVIMLSGDISRSLQPKPLHSETDAGVAEWTTVDRAPRTNRVMQMVEGAPRNPLLLQPAPTGFRYIWSHASNDAILVAVQRVAVNAGAAARTPADCAQVWGRYMSLADSTVVPMSAEVAAVQRQFAHVSQALRYNAAESLVLTFVKPHLAVTHSQGDGPRVTQRVEEADAKVANEIGSAMVTQACGQPRGVRGAPVHPVPQPGPPVRPVECSVLCPRLARCAARTHGR